MHNVRRILPVLLILALAAAGIWYLILGQRTAVEGPLQASGTVETVDVNIAPELSGRVVEVLVSKGDTVRAGDPLLRLDDEMLQSQRQRASAAQNAAQANLHVAQTGLEMAQVALQMAEISQDVAQVQYDMTLNAARAADAPARQQDWEEDIPNEFDQPAWYFSKSDEITAARAEVDAARDLLAAEEKNLATVIQSASNEDLRSAEERLAKARAAFLVADEILERAKNQSEEEVKDFAQSQYDAAEAELEAAQSAYDRILSETASEDVLEARARLAVAQERYETAMDHLNGMLTGEDALQVKSASLALKQAEAAVYQAKVGVGQAQARVDQANMTFAQAQAELNVLDVQIKKLVVYASTDGVITSRNVEAGEVIQPGAPVLTIGRLDRLTITVYIPEDRYGHISLGDVAEVTVDSFPGESFSATVTYIADQAEFTPRNVQTAEGRRTTVFAVELTISQTAVLMPGMPADVNFGQ